ncbi:methylmalonyl-CoA mutase subunit beta [Nonomuraea typhae]|uniref:methylmalonyl-CoA mutase subunit beta n=1 Tax=Nonomuraea typhae TaxID=2603600 RepID=UPI0012F7C1B6|nr:methylmalonyl-CoA mutase subunit beta [Nonomuraea typhae]
MKLAAGYPPTTRDDWHAMAVAVLSRSGLEFDALTSRTYDGLTLQPLYDAADLPAGPRPPLGARGWDVRQRHAVADPEAVLADLENGVTSLWLVVGDDGIPAGELPRVLKDVYLDLAPVVLEAGESVSAAAEVLLGPAAAGQGSVRGNLGASLGAAGPAVVAALATRCAREHPGLRAVVVDATPYHDAGAGDAQELGCSLALGVAHLRVLTEAGLSVEQALGQLEFRYAATADQFATIAKLRAARVTWRRVAEACGAPAKGQLQHAVTSSAMMTARDPWVNMLRTTLACFAAGVGGADAVTVQPFDARFGAPDAFGRRIARNTHALLMEESGVARVADPAGGSWYVERRTAELAEAAWAWFQEIEAAGGLPGGGEEVVAAGIARVRAMRDGDIAHRRFPITGVSEFPNLAEEPLRSTRAARPGPDLHYADAFEELRDLADAQPERPTVFLATIGPVAAHTARASFAANLFQAGGLATESAGPGTDPGQIATAFAVSGARVACLCSTDRLYGEHAEAVAAALKRAGARRVWLAGKGEYEHVDGRLFAGCDALAVLRTTFEDLEVAR